jgi:hypothetical protein
MKPSQIRLFCLTLTVAVLCCGPASARERPATAPAARFLQETIDRAVGLVRPPVTPKAAADLETLIESAMDWPDLTHFAIGHYGADLTADGMSGVTRKLEQRVEILARRAGVELPTMTVAVHDMRIDPDGRRHILSTATVPRFGEVELEWTLAPTPMGTEGAGYRIADIKALGMTLRQFLRSWVAGQVAARGGNAAAAFEATDPAVASDKPAATSPQ